MLEPVHDEVRGVGCCNLMIDLGGLPLLRSHPDGVVFDQIVVVLLLHSCSLLLQPTPSASHLLPVTNWFVLLSGDPQPMHEHSELASHRHGRALLRCLPSVLG